MQQNFLLINHITYPIFVLIVKLFLDWAIKILKEIGFEDYKKRNVSNGQNSFKNGKYTLF